MKTDKPTTSIYGDNPLRTRADFQQAARDLFEPLVPYYEKGGARVVVGPGAATYDEASESVETFIRPLWALAPLAHGGGSFEHWDLIRQGLINGTDPNHEQYWGAVGATPGLNPVTDQRMVEMAAFGFAMALAPEEFFDPLTDEQKRNVLNWLAPINEIGLRDNNWQFFRVLVNCGLEAVGAEPNWEAAEESLATLDSNYKGDGWYQDGEMQKTTDYYIPFAFHFYSMIYVYLRGQKDPERAETFRRRIAEFSPDWEARFDSSGRAIAYGRSMTYRFAGAGFFGALALGDVEGVDWAEIRGLWAKHIRWFGEQDIVDANGVLTVGWGYHNQLMTESYNAPGSPYWAMKAFLPLALPEDHPFWATEENPDAGSTEKHIPQPHADVVVQRTATQSQMLNAGGKGFWFPRHGAAKYGKLAYSSAFPFCLESDDLFAFTTAESNLVFVDSSRRYRESRLWNDASGIEGDIAWAQWSVFRGDVKVTTVMRGEGDAHVRLHVVDVAEGSEFTAVEGGFAIEWRYDPATDEYERREENEGGVHTAFVGSSTASSILVDPTGRRTAVVREMTPMTSLQWTRSTAPMLETTLSGGRHVLVAATAANERPAEASVDTAKAADDELWGVLEKVLGAKVERPALS